MTAASGFRPADGAVVALDGLERRFGERRALHDVSIRVGQGETLGVFGPNGAGKTTLLRVVAALLRPHAGSVSVAGADLPDEAWRMRGKVGFLGHEPMLYRQLTARENLDFHARLHGVPRERVDELLAAVGLERRAGDPVGELSRGIVQRLAAARAVLHSPPLLLLDEPWANLDPAAIERLEPLIGRSSARTRVVATHDLGRGLTECDLALGLRAGRQVLAAPAGDVDRSSVTELYA